MEKDNSKSQASSYTDREGAVPVGSPRRSERPPEGQQKVLTNCYGLNDSWESPKGLYANGSSSTALMLVDKAATGPNWSVYNWYLAKWLDWIRLLGDEANHGIRMPWKGGHIWRNLLPVSLHLFFIILPAGALSYAVHNSHRTTSFGMQTSKPQAEATFLPKKALTGILLKGTES